jgi:hypothetical protein
LKAGREEVVSPHGRLKEEEVASVAEELSTPLPGKGGISRLRVVFFFPLLPQEDIVKVLQQTSFSLRRGEEAEKEGLWPMREGLGERFRMVFSVSVIVRDAEL